MKTRSTRSSNSFNSHRYLLLIIGISIVFVALATVPLFSTAASSIRSRVASPQPRDLPSSRQASNLLPGVLNTKVGLPTLAPLVETMDTFAADCTTPKSSFFLGETVCAKTDDVDLGYPGGRWVHWLRQDHSIAHGSSTTTLITANPQFFSFVPDQIGSWKVTIAETGDDFPDAGGFYRRPCPGIYRDL